MSRATIPMKRRQTILDFLNSHGPATTRQIADATGFAKKTIGTWLRDMRNDGEVSVHDEYVGRVLHVTYTANMEKTTMGARAKEEKPKTVTIVRPGYIANYGTQRDHPVPSGGGQGALRQEFGIQSSAALL